MTLKFSPNPQLAGVVAVMQPLKLTHSIESGCIMKEIQSFFIEVNL